MWKYWVLLIVLIIFFASKFIPFYLDNKLSLSTYGYYYGVESATKILHQLSTADNVIYSNIHPYKVQYLADDPRIDNTGAQPKVRTFQKNYPELYLRFLLDDTFMDSLTRYGVNYVFIVNDQYDQTELKIFNDIRKNNPKDFKVVKKQYLNNRLQWALYKVISPKIK